MAPQNIKTDFPFFVFSLEADKDYLLSRYLNFHGAGFHSRAGYMAHQACEKYLKALSVETGSQYLETHKLLELANECIGRDPYFGEEKTRSILKIFDTFEQVGRYGAAAKFDPLATKSASFQTAGVMVWDENYLQYLDAFVFKIRGLFDFEKVGHVDNFRGILNRDRKSFFMASWKGKMPIRVVLTKENRCFAG